VSVHRSYLEIDISALKHNLAAIKTMTAETCQFMAIVKGNAWGAGSQACARAFVEAGADWFGTTTIEDAALLRHEFDLPILLLCAPPLEKISEAVTLNIDIAVSSILEARHVSRSAAKLGRHINLHIKINTGLNRLGVPPENATSFVKEVMAYEAVTVAGIFSHFSCADDPSLYSITCRELDLFNQTIRDVRANTEWSGMIHIANTAATLSLPESHLDMVRVSLGLMGLNANLPLGKAANIKQVYSWKSDVIHVIDVDKGDRVGYGGQYECPTDTTIVTIPVGWADGLPKAYVNGGQVIIAGSLRRIVAMSMDMATVDLGKRTNGIDVGEEVVIFGQQHGETLEPMSQGEKVGIDADATLTLISERVPRVYR